MSFGNLKTPEGLKKLNSFLADHSYIEGYAPSKADLSVFQTIGKTPSTDLEHVCRWYRHIASYDSKTQASWGGNAIPQAAGGNTTTVSDNKAADDDDVDLFGSDDEEDADAAKIREERVAAYAAKKSKKPVLIAKSSVLLDCKPWDDETDMKAMEEKVRSIQMDGLLWGASKLVPVGYGIKKLQIMCVIEDEKVSIDLLTENIQEFEDFVQSVDIAAFNKI